MEVCQSEVVDEFDDGVFGDGVGVVEDREGILHEGCVKVSVGVDTVSKSGSFPWRRQARELMGNTVRVQGKRALLVSMSASAVLMTVLITMSARASSLRRSWRDLPPCFGVAPPLPGVSGGNEAGADPIPT